MVVKLVPESVVLEEHLGGAVDRTTLYRWRKAGKFPEPIKFHGGRSLYVEAEVVAAIERRIAERDAQAEALIAARNGAPPVGVGG